MTDTNITIIIAFIIVALVVVVGIVFMAMGGSTDEPENPVIEEFTNTNQEAVNVTNEFVNLSKVDNQSYKITGRIGHSNGGGKVVVNSFDYTNNTIRLHLSVENDGIGTTVMTSYEYEAMISNVDDETEFIVNHGDKKYEPKINEDHTVFTEDDFNVSVKPTGTSSNVTEGSKVLEWSENTIRIVGEIRAEQAGEKIVVENYSVSEGNLDVELDTVAQDGFYPQVVLTQQYELNITSDGDISDLSTVTVNHMNGESYEFSEDSNLPELKANLVNTSLSSENLDDRASVNRDGNGAVITGQIVGSTGGQEVVMQRVWNENDKTYINIGLEKPDGFATQVMTGYNYEVSISNSKDDIVVQHNGKRVGSDLGEPIDESNYKFKPDEGSEGTIGKVIENTEDRIVLDGAFTTGSSSCTMAGLKSITLSEDQTLNIHLTPMSRPDSSNICTDDISQSSYRLEVDKISQFEKVHIIAEQRHHEKVEKDIDI